MCVIANRIVQSPPLPRKSDNGDGRIIFIRQNARCRTISSAPAKDLRYAWGKKKTIYVQYRGHTIR
jgi:hypothetical protein